MKPTLQTFIVAAVFASASFAGGSSLFAGQKMQAILNNTEIGRELSAGELLQQFRTERQRLLRQKAKDKQPHLIKNKIKILDGKISFLESQLKRARPMGTPVPAAAAAKPAVVPQPAVVKAAAPAPRTPVSVSWRPYARPEPRRRIFVAKVQKKVEPQPAAGLSERLAPETKALPKKVSAPAPAVPSALQKPVIEKPVVSPVSVKMASASLPSVRESAMTRPVPEKILPPAAPAPQKIEPPAPAVPAPASRGIKTGSDWKNMTAAEKDIYALSVMGNLGRRDVFLEKSYGFYVREIDRRLQNDPSLDGEYVYKILITTAYENEPEVRQDIDKIGT